MGDVNEALGDAISATRALATRAAGTRDFDKALGDAICATCAADTRSQDLNEAGAVRDAGGL
jgi:hypothetical protein